MRSSPLVLAMLSASALAAEPDAILHVENAPGASVALPVSVPCDREMLLALAAPPAEAAPPSAVLTGGGERIGLPVSITADRIYSLLPAGVKGTAQIGLYLRGQPAPEAPRPVRELSVSQFDGIVNVANEYFTIFHAPRKMAGLPCRVEFPGSKTFENYAVNDRVHDPKLGSFLLRNDTAGSVTVVASTGAMATVEISARYMQDGRPTPTNARATYRFTYFAGSPIVYVEATVTQDSGHSWAELHFLEINFPDDFFRGWACGEPRAQGPFKGDQSSHSGSVWGALADADRGIGLFDCGTVRIYDGRGGYGCYLYGPWVPFDGSQRSFSAKLLIGRVPNPTDTIALVASQPVTAYLTTPPVQTMLSDCRARLEKLERGGRRGGLRWLLELGHRLAHGEGRLFDGAEIIKAVDAALAGELPFDQALQALPPRLSNRWAFAQNDSIGLLAEEQPDHIHIASLFDLRREREVLSPRKRPLWALELQLPDKTRLRLDSSAGWQQHAVSREGAKLSLQWLKPADERLADIAVSVAVSLDGPRTQWRMKLTNKGQTVALREIVFPDLALVVTDADAVIVPSVSGRMHRQPLSRRVSTGGEYPSGWLSMQCAGFCGPAGSTYVGLHDPFGSTKNLTMATTDGFLRIAWTWPAPDCGVPGSAWEQPGELCVEPFDGDWFDFAQIYRRWVVTGASWWPRDKQIARPDTPDWLKDIAVWVCAGGSAKEVVEPVTRFAKYLDVPVAVHWYSWHVIPFDDDYPHYFPAKEGFAEGVAHLQESGIRVMPYINGRLWDTDTEDFKAAAISAATKAEDGSFYTEEYGSKQKLAPMCPTTELWQKTVTDTVTRLISQEFNVDGVYIDQVAAASPRLCFDKSHGHPLAGGHWWTTDGYWPMLRALRKLLPYEQVTILGARRPTVIERPAKMITTECNAEPFVNLFDGYLTWHFQDNDAIPLFAAVYGGQVQMLSRAYQGDSWKGLAMRMKTAQALVFGEQLGWMGPNVVDDPVAGPFLRQLGKLRYALRAYLARGRMARPPKIKDDGATVTADWQWSGNATIVTTPAVLSSAWQAADGRVALIFVNVDDKPHTFGLMFDGADYGLEGEDAELLLTTLTGLEERDAPLPEPEREGLTWARRIALAARSAIAIEVKAQKIDRREQNRP